MSIPTRGCGEIGIHACLRSTCLKGVKVQVLSSPPLYKIRCYDLYMNEKLWPKRRTPPRGILGVLEASKSVSRALEPNPQKTPQERQALRLLSLGRHFKRTINVMYRNGSEVAAEIIEDHMADRARRKRMQKAMN
jgi:hypothetical protein